MTTEKEVDDQIRRDIIIPFYEKIYDADVPPLIIEHFSRVIRAIPPSEHNLGTERWGKLIATKPDEINHADVMILLNAIYSCPPYMLFATLEEQFEHMQRYDQFKADYNKVVKDFQVKIFQTKDTRMKLSGVTRSAKYQSNLKLAEA